MKNLLFILLFGILASASIPALAQTIPISPVAVCLPPDSVAPDRLILRFAVIRKFYDSASAFCPLYYYVATDSSFAYPSVIAPNSIPPQTLIYTYQAGGTFYCTAPPHNNDTIWVSLPFLTPSRPARLYYQLQMYNCGKYGGISNTVRVDFPRNSTQPTVPSLLRPIGITNNAMTVMWNKAFGSIATDTMRYTVQLSADSTFANDMRESITKDTILRFTALRPDTRYFFRLKARNSAGESRFSSSAIISTLSSEANYFIDTNPNFYLPAFRVNDILYFFNMNRRLLRKQGDSLVKALYNAKAPIDSIFFRASSFCAPASQGLGLSTFIVLAKQRNDSLMRALGYENTGVLLSLESCCPTREDILYYSFSPQTSIREEATVSSLALFSPAPNPTSSETTLRFALPNDVSVSVSIIDVLGTTVAAPIYRASFAQGEHNIRLNLAALASGSYRVRLDALSSSSAETRFVQLHILK